MTDSEDNNNDISNILSENLITESEPRSIERIDELLDELEQYWKDNPDLRLSQIISIISNENGFGDDPFYMEDELIIEYLKEQNTA